MPIIASATAEAIQKTEGLSTSQFRYGLHKEAPVDLTPSQAKIAKVLKFKAENAVRKQKEFEAGVPGGKPPTEMDQTAARLWAQFKEGKSLNEMPAAQVAQTYFILREIENTGRTHEYFRDAVKQIKDPREKDRVIDGELGELKKIIPDFEKKLVGRNHGKVYEKLASWGHEIRYRTKRPGAREILIMDDYIKKFSGNVEKAAAAFSSDQISVVLEQRAEGVAEAVGEDKIEAAKNSANPKEKRTARAIEKAVDLPAKALKKRREMKDWGASANGAAAEYRAFMNLTEAEINDRDLLLAIGESNPDLLEKGFKGLGFKVAGKKAEDLAKLGNLLNKKDLTGAYVITDAQAKVTANQLVQLLVREHSFNSVTDTAFDILQKLGDRLPEAAEKAEKIAAAKKPELAPTAGEKAGLGDIVMALSKGMTEAEMLAKGFKKDAIEKTRRKYFYKDAISGQYKLKEVKPAAGVGGVDQEEADQKKVIYTKYKPQADLEMDRMIEENIKNDLLTLERTGTLTKPSGATVAYEADMLRIATHLGIVKIGGGGGPWAAGDLSLLKGQASWPTVEKFWQNELKTTEYNPGWRAQDAQKIRAAERYMSIAANDPVAAEYAYSVKSIRDNDIGALGPEAAISLKAGGQLIDAGNLIEARFTAADVIGPTGLKDTATGAFKKDATLASMLAKKPRVSLLTWALYISMGLMSMDHALTGLTAENRDADAAELQKMLS